MRVLMVILDNRIGGISIRAIDVAQKLQEDEISTLFIVPKEKGALAARLNELHLPVNQIILGRPSLKRIWANIYWFFSFPLSVIILMSLILREKIDIVHVNGLLSLQAPVAALLTGRRIVWHLASTIYPPFLVRLLMPFICRVSFVMTISESVDHYYVGKNTKCSKRLIVHEPVNIHRFSPDITTQERDQFRQNLGVGLDELVVGVVGNITPVKGYDYLFQAVPLVVKVKPEVHFVIVGAMFNTQLEYKKKLDLLANSLGIKEHIRFLGQRHDIRELLNAFDLFVLPSLHEGTPIAILEAMAMERAVVATRVGGVSDLVIDQETGLLVKAKNPEKLAESILDLLDDDQKRTAMGKSGRKRITQLFSLEHCVHVHKMIYCQLYNPDNTKQINNES